jgi:predicted membrane channel-forming protein YqfA (hemolysin III family)
MMAASSGGYGNSDPDTIEIAALVAMAVVFVTLTLFSNAKDNTAKNRYRYISAAIVIALFVSSCVMLAMTRYDATLLFIFVLVGIVSVTLSYQLIRYKLPEN